MGTGEVRVTVVPPVLYLMIFPDIAGGGRRLFENGLPASKRTLTHQEAGELGEIAMVYDRVR